MGEDIFDFWLRCPPAAHVHPDDEAVLGRCRHSFDLRCLPGAFSGPLKTAPVVLLLSNPGFDKYDIGHAIDPAARQWYHRQRAGIEPLPTAREHETAYGYWTSLVRQFGLAPEEARSRVAILDLAAYHSSGFHDANLLLALPSSRIMMDWAQDVLFPAAVSGERAVVCLRASRLWGLPPGRLGEALFVPKVNHRRPFMLNGEERKQVSSAIRARVVGR